ncbi:MAG: right-handed parallel beta-helix repeat-containing protein, partial [Nitrososphaerota archaeon]
MPARRRGSAFRTPTQRAQLWEKKMDGETYSRILSRTKHLALPRITEYQAVHENLISIVKSVLERLGKSHQTHEYMWYAEELYKATQTYTGQALQNKVNAIYAKYRAQKLDDDALMKIANSFGLTPDPIEKIFEISLVGPGGGPPFIVIAATDTPSFLKGRANIVCDGVSDQEEINSALNSAPTVYLCPGTYIIDATITIPSHRQLIGAGPSSVIKLKDNYNADIYMIQNSNQTDGNTEITISNLTIDGNRRNQTGGRVYGMHLIKVTSSKIESCVLKDFSSYYDEGIYASMLRDVEFIGNTSLDTLYVLDIYDSRRITVSRNTCTSSQEPLIFYGCDYCIISENLLITGLWTGISLWESNYNVISGNICIDHNSRGIYVGDSFDNIISENICQNNDFMGIELDYGGNNVVAGNYAESNGFAGITVTASNDNLIIGNQCYKNAYYGIIIRDSGCYNLV